LSLGDFREQVTIVVNILSNSMEYSAAMKADYIRMRQEEVQRNIVNVRNTSSSVVGSTSWTFRTTGCEVVSVVTTTMPLKNGQMKDVRLHNKEMRRIKPPPQRAPGKVNPGNPLQTADELDEEKVSPELFLEFQPPFIRVVLHIALLSP
jgi:hypothetical protein